MVQPLALLEQGYRNSQYTGPLVRVWDSKCCSECPVLNVAEDTPAYIQEKMTGAHAIGRRPSQRGQHERKYQRPLFTSSRRLPVIARVFCLRMLRRLAADDPGAATESLYCTVGHHCNTVEHASSSDPRDLPAFLHAAREMYAVTPSLLTSRNLPLNYLLRIALT